MFFKYLLFRYNLFKYNQEYVLPYFKKMNIMENWKIVVCPKCHKEFKDVILFPHHGRKCPHCGEIQMVYTIESSKRNNNQRENPSNNGSEDNSD